MSTKLCTELVNHYTPGNNITLSVNYTGIKINLIKKTTAEPHKK